MSKVLKFIVHLVVICTLVCVLGLVLPPFFGVRTVIVDKADEATNLPVGSVTYAIPEKSSAISVGTPILVQKDSKTYKYTLRILILPREPEPLRISLFPEVRRLQLKLEIMFRK